MQKLGIAFSYTNLNTPNIPWNIWKIQSFLKYLSI